MNGFGTAAVAATQSLARLTTGRLMGAQLQAWSVLRCCPTIILLASSFVVPASCASTQNPDELKAKVDQESATASQANHAADEAKATAARQASEKVDHARQGIDEFNEEADRMFKKTQVK